MNFAGANDVFLDISVKADGDPVTIQCRFRMPKMTNDETILTIE